MSARRRLLAVAVGAAVAAGLTGGGAATASSITAPFPLQAIGGLAQPLEDFLAQAVAASAQAPTGIVRSVGTHLVLDGQSWRFIGYNDYKLTSQSYAAGYTCGGEHSDAEVDSDVAEMKARGATVLRTWFFQSFVAGRNWSAFDRILTVAARYGMRVVPVLANQFGDCEDFNYSPALYKDLGWYRSGYATRLDYGLPMTYRDYVLEVVRRYAGDPRVAFWQLMNEAEANTSVHGQCDEAGAATALRGFADTMIGLVKAGDPAHLVSLGTIGGSQCGTLGPDYLQVHAGAVDICEYHDYTATPAAAPRGNRCLAIHKPTFVGERGFNADAGTGHTDAGTLAQRAALFQKDVTSVFADDAAQGYLLWSWTSGDSQGQDIGPADPVGVLLAAVVVSMTTPAAISASLWLANHRSPPASDA